MTKPVMNSKANVGQVALTVVVPAFNEENSVSELVERIDQTLAETGAVGSYEILFVDDGSTDSTLATIKDCIRCKSHVRVAVLRTNVGKSLALMVGFLHARGELIVTMDADLQDNPEDIPKMIKVLEEGAYDLVSGWRERREDSQFRKAGSWLFNRAIRLLMKLDIKDQNCGFKVIRAELARRLYVYGQFHRFIPLQAHLIGYRVAEIAVRNSERKYGISKYRAIRYEGLFDFLSVVFSLKYGFSPLHFFGLIAMAFLVPSSLILFYLLSMHLMFMFTGEGSQLFNRPILSLSLTTFQTGVIILMTGLVCDFVLHHHAKTNMSSLTEHALLEVVGFETCIEESSPVERRPFSAKRT
jgi:glycosyltransferase involved in cell wall biosynthesis